MTKPVSALLFGLMILGGVLAISGQENEPSDLYDIKIKKIKDNIYLAYRPEPLRLFVEGNSTGRTSARSVFDAPDRFNLWRRQDFDQPVTSSLEGGKVWEHWCTLRDLRSSNRLATCRIRAVPS